MLSTIKSVRDWYLSRVKWRKYSIGRGFHAGVRVRLWAKDNISIGNYCYIGRDSQIETNCTIGHYVIFGNRVAVVGRYDHNYQEIGTPIRIASQIRDKNYSWKGINQMTSIGDDVWVGYGTIILSGVTINNGSIIAAGSIVTKDVEAYSIYAGNPAKKLRDRFESEADKEKHIINIRNKYSIS